MPAAAALDQLDPVPFVMGGELAERDLDRTIPDMLDNFIDSERRVGGENGRFDCAGKLVH
jgi:hypothetical protein